MTFFDSRAERVTGIVGGLFVVGYLGLYGLNLFSRYLGVREDEAFIRYFNEQQRTIQKVEEAVRAETEADNARLGIVEEILLREMYKGNKTVDDIRKEYPYLDESLMPRGEAMCKDILEGRGYSVTEDDEESFPTDSEDGLHKRYSL